MTTDQLDEIEKLAEAATPGPWTARLTDRGHALWGPLPSGDCGSMRIALASYAAFDRANMLFVEGMRECALPLVKALREARKERDALQAVVSDWQRFAMRARDWQEAAIDARAEVERLKAATNAK